jgi:very-short-patch-repair endonuclease
LKQKELDLMRTEGIQVYGYTVFRFTNQQVLENWNEVVKIIREYIENYRGLGYEGVN